MQHGTRDNKRCSKGQLCLLSMSAGLTLGQGPSPLRCEAAGTFEMNSSIETPGPRSDRLYNCLNARTTWQQRQAKQKKKKEHSNRRFFTFATGCTKKEYFFPGFLSKILFCTSYAECKEAFSTATSEQSAFISLHPSRCSRVLAAFRARIISFLRKTGLSSS